MSSRKTVSRTTTVPAAAVDHFQMPYEPSQTSLVPVLLHRPRETWVAEQ